METKRFTFGPESGRVEAMNLRVGTEVCDDGNTANEDGCKTPGSGWETSNNKIEFTQKWEKKYLKNN